MKVGLRDKFKTTDFLDISQPSLERIGALYYLGQQADKPEIQEKLKHLFNFQVCSSNHHETLLCLHAATLLAQHGDFAGIEFILDLLSRGDDKEQFRLAETALRNCSQFPLAVLLAQLIDLGNVSQLDERVIGLMKQSDDDLFELSHEKKQKSYLHGLIGQLEILDHLPHLRERVLSIGTIISRPIRKDFGFRYTGFIAIDNSHQDLLVVPYDMGDVLNRNDQRARQDVYQLLARPGHRAIVVHDVNPPYEVRQLYILPFAAQTQRDTEKLVSKLAEGAEGLHVGIVAELSVDKKGAYRIITVDGQSQLGHYMANRKKIGNAFFIHEDNSKPLNTRFSVSENTVSHVIQRFKENSPLDVAVYIRTYENQQWYASRNGHLVNLWAKSAPAVCFVDEVIIEGERRYFPFELPELDWTFEERVSILTDYWKKIPDSWAVVLNVYEQNGERFALIGHPYSRSPLVKRVNHDFFPGTLVFCEKGEKRVRVNPWDNVGNKYSVGQLVEGPITSITSFGAFLEIEPGLDGLIHVSQLAANRIDKVEDIVKEGEIHLVRIISIDNNSQRIGLSLKEVTVAEQASWQAEDTLDKGKQQDTELVEVYFGHVLQDYRIVGGCEHCFGVGKRVCIDCNGNSKIACPNCNGTGQYICKKCNGSGQTRCAACGGTGACSKCTGGYWRSGRACPVCNATGKCQSCKPSGSGFWNCNECHGRGRNKCGQCFRGQIECSTCNGERIIKCSCGGKDKGHIVAAT